MIRRKGTLERVARERMMGGDGVFYIDQILLPEEMHGKGRLFAKGTLAPGDSVGYHVHEKDMEVCYFLEGTGTVEEDGGAPTPVAAGDCSVTEPGHGHKICNTGNTNLVYIALILFA